MKLLTLISYAFAAGLAVARSHANESLVPPSHRLTRRVDDEWRDAKCKGEKLIAAMLASDAEAGPKIQSTKDNQPPSAKSQWQGDLKRTFRLFPLPLRASNNELRGAEDLGLARRDAR